MEYPEITNLQLFFFPVDWKNKWFYNITITETLKHPQDSDLYELHSWLFIAQYVITDTL